MPIMNIFMRIHGFYEVFVSHFYNMFGYNTKFIFS